MKKPGHHPVVERDGALDRLTPAILDSITDGVFTVDGEWRISSFNRSAERITGIPAAEAIGLRCSDVFRSSLCGEMCALRRTMETGRPLTGITAFIIRSDGQRVPVSLSTAVLRDAGESFIGGVETFRDMSEIEALRTELEGLHAIGGMTSRSPLMQKLFGMLPAIAASSATVMILGETGTGKEVLARTIHAIGARAREPFVAVNCGALPETLLESELFGFVRGAFTGANRNVAGRFAAAGRGTLFLDEISETSPAMQVKLLRVLQERTFEPLGTSTSRRMDARVIVASNRDPGRLVERGLFRQDLFYRVNVVRIEVPPLRQRREDIPLLVEQFVRRFNLLQGRAVIGTSPEAMSMLMTHHWPGNVRELENVIERAFVLCGGDVIEAGHLPATLIGPIVSTGAGTRAGTDIKSARRRYDAGIILSALDRNAGNVTAAARELGIHRTTLHRRIRTLGLESAASGPDAE